MLNITNINLKKVKSLLIGGALAITITGCGIQQPVNDNKTSVNYEQTRDSYDTTSERIVMVMTDDGYHLADVYRLDEVPIYFTDGDSIVEKYTLEGISAEDTKVYFDALTGEIISVLYKVVEHITYKDPYTGEDVSYDKKYATFDISPVYNKEDITESVRLNCEGTTITREEAITLTGMYNGEVNVNIPQVTN